jgi:hypothetical protein
MNMSIPDLHAEIVQNGSALFEKCDILDFEKIHYLAILHFRLRLVVLWIKFISLI